MACIYRHIRLDKNEVFYVGISKNEERPYDKNKRSRFWKSVIAKTDYVVEIMMEHEDYQYLKTKEIEFISLYGRIDKGAGTLVNMTDGGEGSLGNKHTDERKAKMSALGKLRTGAMTSNYGKITPDDVRLKISVALTGKKRTQETRLRISRSKIKFDKKPRERKGLCRGEKHHAFGKKNEWLANWSKNQTGGFHPKSVKIIDESTGLIYSSIIEASQKTGINYSTLKSNLNPRRINRTKFKYLNE